MGKVKLNGQQIRKYQALANEIDIDDIKEYIISEYGAEHTSGTHEGHRFKAICHNGDSPGKLTLNKDKNSDRGIFSCMSRGCVRGVDIVGFVQHMDELNYPQALMKVLKDFELVDDTPLHEKWIDEGIKESVLKKYGIKVSGNNILHIPVCLITDISKIIGDKIRNPDKLILEGEPKYKYPKGFEAKNYLFGIEHNYGYITWDKREVILLEGEKSVMKIDGWEVINQSLALGGHNVHDEQVEYLHDIGVKIVYLALDEGVSLLDIYAQAIKLDKYFEVFIVPTDGLPPKYAPVDLGRSDWNDRLSRAYPFEDIKDELLEEGKRLKREELGIWNTKHDRDKINEYKTFVEENKVEIPSYAEEVLPGRLNLIIGPTNMGKSHMLQTLAIELASEGSVLYLTAEQQKEVISSEIMDKIDNTNPELDVDVKYLPSGSEEELKKVLMKLEDLSYDYIMIDYIKSTTLVSKGEWWRNMSDLTNLFYETIVVRNKHAVVFAGIQGNTKSRTIEVDDLVDKYEEFIDGGGSTVRHVDTAIFITYVNRTTEQIGYVVVKSRQDGYKGQVYGFNYKGKNYPITTTLIKDSKINQRNRKNEGITII